MGKTRAQALLVATGPCVSRAKGEGSGWRATAREELVRQIPPPARPERASAGGRRAACARCERRAETCLRELVLPGAAS